MTARTPDASGTGLTGRLDRIPVVRLLPGLVLLVAIGLVGKFAQNGLKAIGAATGTALPDIEYVLWAIVLGLLIRNTVGVARVFRPGIETYELWLKIGIVLLGARFVLGDLAKVGGVSLVLILIDMTIATTVILLLARRLRLGGKLGSLLAVGTSICGVSAIIAAKGAIEADDEDAGYSIAAILALGAVALFTFPLVGHALGMTDHEFGLWAGLAVDNTAETTATGALFSPAAQEIAVLVKSTRNALIGFVVLGYAIYWASRGQARGIHGAGARTAFLWAKFPKFVLGFLAVSLVVTLGAVNATGVESIGNLSKWAFLLTFAGVGLNTDFRAMARSGLRPLLVAIVALVVVAATSLLLVYGTSHLIGLD